MEKPWFYQATEVQVCNKEWCSAISAALAMPKGMEDQGYHEQWLARYLTDIKRCQCILNGDNTVSLTL